MDNSGLLAVKHIRETACGNCNRRLADKDSYLSVVDGTGNPVQYRSGVQKLQVKMKCDCGYDNHLAYPDDVSPEPSPSPGGEPAILVELA